MSNETLLWAVPSAITVLGSIIGWGLLLIRQSDQAAYKRGEDAAALKQEKEARGRLFEQANSERQRLRELEAQVDNDRAWTREILIKGGIFVPEGTQSGEGRGVPNPLRRTGTITKSDG